MDVIALQSRQSRVLPLEPRALPQCGRALSLLALCIALVAGVRESSAATLKSVQSGSVTLSDGLPVVALLPTAVDQTKAFLVFGTSENSADPGDGQVSGQINAAGTAVTFDRVAGVSSITLKYYVAEFSSGVSVQRGSVDIGGGAPTFDVTLAPAIDTGKSFPLVSYRVGGVNFNCNDFFRAKITSATNLQLSTNSPSCGVNPGVVEWQVVEYLDATVQTGDVDLSVTDLSLTAAPAPAVNTAKSWLVYSYESAGNTNDIGQYLVRGRVTDPTTLTFDRNNSGAVSLTLTWYLVEFTDATVVQRGSQPFLTAETQRNATLAAPAPPGASIAVGGGDYQRGGRSPYAANDVAGVGWFTFDLTSPTNLQITRGAGGLDAADVGWFVVTFAPPTAVELMSFSAVGSDSAVEVSWQTGSELDNLGFHVHRSPSESGPWTRLTSSLIPGLGSSPLGATYSWRDSGLVNGRRYFYRLEDVDTSSVSALHGPVSAVPAAGQPATPPPPPPPRGGGGSGPGGPGPSASSCPAWVLAAYAAPPSPAPAAYSSFGESSSSITCRSYGDPSATALRVLSRTAAGAVVELSTGGFVALREGSGSLRVFVPGLEFVSDSSFPALPFKRALVEAVVGRGVELESVEGSSLLSYSGLRPSAVGTAEMAFFRSGAVRPSSRPAPLRLPTRGFLPREQARLAGVVFQGEDKRALVEIFPLRFDAARNELVLARRVRVKLAFSGVETTETGQGSVGKRAPRTRPLHDVIAQLYTSARGLHAIRFEQLFPQSRHPLARGLLGLQRQGQAVPFQIEPVASTFGPGSVLFFYADTLPSSTDFSAEIAYELVRSRGPFMARQLAPPAGASLSTPSFASAFFETNRIYQPGLLEAPDIWLWDAVMGGVAHTQSFSLSGVDALASLPARLAVDLQGGSDAEGVVDHHLRVSINGTAVGETSFDGKRAVRFEASLPPSLLHEGGNDLTLENVGDTGVYSLVFLDKFSLAYPQAASMRGGVFEGTWTETGTAEVATSSRAVVLDVTAPAKWLTGFESTPSSLRFFAQAGHRYLVVSRDGLLAPRISIPAPSSLRSTRNQADLVVIAPRAFLPAAEPLMERRRSQGLSALGVSLEDVVSVFGHAQASPEAVKSFLAFAFHSWSRPSPRYVLLLGESTTDPRNFSASAHPSPLPALWLKTSYLWTVSDPSLAAVNGEDPLPDLAIGRLPASTAAEAQQMVAKVLDWEDSGQNVDGKAVLVADNPDDGGDFEADSRDIARSFLAGRDTQEIFLSRLGSQTRPAILDAFNAGASLMSYVGHGGSAVWASENILNSWDPPSLQAQSRQPLLLTWNCLNGYFVAPNFDSLSEALLKVQGRGAIASFSPSGLSLDAPAHLYHRALIAEITSGTHPRLGDAVLAAQKAYAQTGALPELLSLYHLLGDPTLKLR